MKTLFNFQRTKIMAGVTALKDVRMWNNQISRIMITRDEKPVPFPIVFAEYITEEIKPQTCGIKYVFLTVRFRFAIEGYTFERLDNLDFADDFDAIVTSLRGLPTDPVQFSTMTEVTSTKDTDHDQVDQPYIDYRTCWTKTSAYTRKGWNDKVLDLTINTAPF